MEEGQKLTVMILSLDIAGSFAKVAYIRDWIQLDIYINPAFPIG